MKSLPYDEEEMQRDKEFVIKKLDMTNEEFENIWKQKNKHYWDYPSYMPLFQKYFKLSKTFLRKFFPTPPTIIVEKQIRRNEDTN
jgi:hypothetical protein